MINEGIFGYTETTKGEIHDDRVLVKKTHTRTVLDAALPAGQSAEFEFYVAQFPFHISVVHSEDEIGTTERPAPRSDVAERFREFEAAIQPTSSSLARRRRLEVGGFNSGLLEPTVPPPPPDRVIPFQITLIPPNRLQPIVYANPKVSQVTRWPTDTARIDPTYIDRGKGKWKISVKNTNASARRLYISVISTHAIAKVLHQDIPLSLLNNLSSVALHKSLPIIEYNNGTIVVSTPTHFLELMGVDRTLSLGPLEKLIDALPTFTPFSAQVMSQARFVEHLKARRESIAATFRELIAGAMSDDNWKALLTQRHIAAINDCSKAITRLEHIPSTMAAFCIVFDGMFADPQIDLRMVGTVAELDNAIPQVGFVFNGEASPQGQFELTDVISNLGLDLSPALAKTALATAALATAVAFTPYAGPILAGAVLLGGFHLYHTLDEIDLEEELRNSLRKMGPDVAKYVTRAVERITDFGANVLRCEIRNVDGSDNLHVTYFNPSTAQLPRPSSPMLSTFGGSAETLVLPPGEIGNRTPRAITHTRRPRTSSYSESSVALRAETPGPVPPAFTIPNPETLQRLDDHESVAIVMMENRSYDHFFHDLPRAYPGRGYSRPPARYRNSAPPGFKEPFAVVRNTYIGIGNSLIFSRSRRSSDPGHNYPHTMFQIGGGSDATRGSGQMRGFAADFAKESDSPQIVMSYFGMDDLPVFKALANVYPVCDRWFAALPVGTFPNRLASFQGNVPFLFNVHMDDPSLGYLEDYSIFDLLTSQDISWKFFESDIGTIRLYDRFRLDVTNVRPIGELEDTLRTASQGGSLPRVMFIEPHFLFGNDDHPPMDIQQGQRFIGQILDKFIAYGQLHKTLFVITYDEHGGFFDHVPPPGTKSSRATIEGIKYGRVESLYPQSPEEAPTCLGVRVPSLVLSKFASANANHSILDHTAIVKTLLLHNRSKIATRQFERFGKRVLKRGHLGQVLDLSSPRPIDYSALRVAIGQAQVSIPSVRSALVAARAVSMTPVHPANVLRGIALPRGRKATE